MNAGISNSLGLIMLYKYSTPDILSTFCLIAGAIKVVNHQTIICKILQGAFRVLIKAENKC